MTERGAGRGGEGRGGGGEGRGGGGEGRGGGAEGVGGRAGLLCRTRRDTRGERGYDGSCLRGWDGDLLPGGFCCACSLFVVVARPCTRRFERRRVVWGGALRCAARGFLPAQE